MKKTEKMNGLYKTGFILLWVCLALLAAAVIMMLLFERPTLGVLLAVAGSVLCLTAIILTMCSKPKPPKEKAEAPQAKITEEELPKALDTPQ